MGEKKQISKETKENIIIVIGLILFIVLICAVVRVFINLANAEHIKEAKRIKAQEMENTVIEENKSKYNEYLENNNGKFNMVVKNFVLYGELTKKLNEKLYIEKIDGGVINFYSKYTYNLSISRNITPRKGLVLTVILIDKDKEKDVEELLGKYTIMESVDDKLLLAVVPKDIEYFEDDKTSADNYAELGNLRQEIMDCVILEKEYDLEGDTGHTH